MLAILISTVITNHYIYYHSCTPVILEEYLVLRGTRVVELDWAAYRHKSATDEYRRLSRMFTKGTNGGSPVLHVKTKAHIVQTAIIRRLGLGCGILKSVAKPLPAAVALWVGRCRYSGLGK